MDSGTALPGRIQVIDRFAQALERLGSAELYVRIGGVYSLEHVLRTQFSSLPSVLVPSVFLIGADPCEWAAKSRGGASRSHATPAEPPLTRRPRTGHRTRRTTAPCNTSMCNE
jgi:hypothetical protein